MTLINRIESFFLDIQLDQPIQPIYDIDHKELHIDVNTNEEEVIYNMVNDNEEFKNQPIMFLTNNLTKSMIMSSMRPQLIQFSIIMREIFDSNFIGDPNNYQEFLLLIKEFVAKLPNLSPYIKNRKYDVLMQRGMELWMAGRTRQSQRLYKFYIRNDNTSYQKHVSFTNFDDLAFYNSLLLSWVEIMWVVKSIKNGSLVTNNDELILTRLLMANDHITMDHRSLFHLSERVCQFEIQKQFRLCIGKSTGSTYRLIIDEYIIPIFLAFIFFTNNIDSNLTVTNTYSLIYELCIIKLLISVTVIIKTLSEIQNMGLFERYKHIRGRCLGTSMITLSISPTNMVIVLVSMMTSLVTTIKI